MNIFAYKIFNFLFWAVLIFVIVLLAEVPMGNSSSDAADTLNALAIIFLPVIVLWIIRSQFSSKFDVKKYRSEQGYKNAINRVKENEEKNRNTLSDRSDKRNIDPVIDITKKELNSRRKYITPDIFERTEIIIGNFRKENNVPNVTDLYYMIIHTKPESLNIKISDYLRNKESKK